MRLKHEKKRFEFLEHTADAYIAAYGKDLNEAFENAASAMFEVMTNVKSVKPEIEDHVEVHAGDQYALLYNWLEALLVKFDTSNLLLSRFKIAEITRDAEGFALTATVWGEKFDSNRHRQKVGVKAVTYHRMEIIQQPGNVTLKFILDV
jgi:SHS2 domain-containing protein